MGTALSILGLGGVAYWNRDALFKFLMITAVVMIICYVIVITTEMPEKHWPPVFMGGILGIGLIYILPTPEFPSLPSLEWTAPEVDKPDRSINPWYNDPDTQSSLFPNGGKRRTKQNKKHKARR